MTTTKEPPILVLTVDTDEMFNHIFNIRTEVFVEELGVSQEDEFDGFDHLSTHLLALYNGTPAGAARFRMSQGSGRIKLERFSVLKAYRQRGIASALMQNALAITPKDRTRYVHAPLAVTGFFKKMQFEAQGEAFEEAGLSSLLMVYTPQ